MSIQVLLRDFPHRTLALTTHDHALVFRHSHSSTETVSASGSSGVPVSNGNRQQVRPRCMVEFAEQSKLDLNGFVLVGKALGTLGLITLNHDVFVCVVTGASQVATVRPQETVQRIHSVEFYCLNRSEYDHSHGQQERNPYPGQGFSSDEAIYGGGYDQSDTTAEHPFHALKKLLNGGYFYYSVNFDLTCRLQDRSDADTSVDIGSLDEGLLWNSYMISPLIQFRSRLTLPERTALDHSCMLTSVIRGFVKTLTIPPSSAPLRKTVSNQLSTVTLISRLSSRRAGTRFNSRGIDDDGNVANFVETETIFWSPSGVCFSYVQIRGSIPIFWESSSSLIPGQQKIQVTRSTEATQPAFDKHFEELARHYGAVHIVNLLSATKLGEAELTEKYRYHTTKCPLRQLAGKEDVSEHFLLRETEFDFHAETKGAGGYEGAKAIRPQLETSADGFQYFMSEEVAEEVSLKGSNKKTVRRPVTILQQDGVFRVNCLDCLDRTNLVQSLISQMALEAFMSHRAESPSSDFLMRHSSLWADNGDTLSKIYAGTGALKSSFTRHGKMSLAGAIADARKSATRLYVNNFADKGRQNTIDLLLGRLIGQTPVHLYDPINDYVVTELNRRAPEYTSMRSIRIWVGTLNLNGRTEGTELDLSSWLCARPNPDDSDPEIIVVGFQEIVELSPQQIMSTDPGRRQVWEDTVKNSLNQNLKQTEDDEYVLLRSGQLVGAALLLFVKASVLQSIKNVEGSIKKTGLSGIAGNKGAVAIRLDYASSSLCFVTAHLAAGFANYEERNRDYKTISSGLRFQKDRSIEDHDSIIWLGDFNYRIGLSHDRALTLVRDGDLKTLYENDQLNIQMVAGMTFPFYSEARITFPPTYKFDLNSDEYDTSEKSRIPAWCDRVLRKGKNLKQDGYGSAPGLRFSDHRAVWATFECDVLEVHERKKSKLNMELYERRKRDVGGKHPATANEGTGDTEEDSSEEESDKVGYESIAPGQLPPASSDRRKWWLDGGSPAKAIAVGPPRDGMVLNDRRPGNPWRQTSEPDWVAVQRPSSTGVIGKRSQNGSGATTPKPELPPPRRRGVAPAWEGERSVSRSSTRGGGGGDGARDRTSLRASPPPPPLPPHATPPAKEATVLSPASSASKKTAPPKPKKPPTLSSSPSSVHSTPAGVAGSPQSVISSETQQAQQLRVDLNSTPPPPTLPMRMNTVAGPHGESKINANLGRSPSVPGHSGFPPPPRRVVGKLHSEVSWSSPRSRPTSTMGETHDVNNSTNNNDSYDDEDENEGPPLPPRKVSSASASTNNNKNSNTDLMDTEIGVVVSGGGPWEQGKTDIELMAEKWKPLMPG